MLTLHKINNKLKGTYVLCLYCLPCSWGSRKDLLNTPWRISEETPEIVFSSFIKKTTKQTLQDMQPNFRQEWIHIAMRCKEMCNDQKVQGDVQWSKN